MEWFSNIILCNDWITWKLFFLFGFVWTFFVLDSLPFCKCLGLSIVYFANCKLLGICIRFVLIFLYYFALLWCASNLFDELGWSFFIFEWTFHDFLTYCISHCLYYLSSASCDSSFFPFHSLLLMSHFGCTWVVCFLDLSSIISK